jgi:hypothetical protein
MRFSSVLFAVAVSVSFAAGCSYQVHVGAHDGGPRDGGWSAECTTDADCALGNQCACGQCITLDLPPPTCDPSCDVAQHGDFCTMEGRRCETGACSVLVCREGSFRAEMGACDGGTWCECPAPPPGCYYDGSPCACDHLTCPGETCGRATCPMGTVCCNASCGTCAPPDVACTAEICAPDCSPQDAHGDGSCGRPMGLWAWNGSECAELYGCMGCVGSECASTFPSRMACEAVFSECGPRACGGFAGAVCSGDEYCDFMEPHSCGGADEQGVCRPRPTACPPEIRTVCGCDGITYASPCDAYTGGADVMFEGSCEMGCEPDDARGVGFCDLALGVVWTGTGCTSISGCSCEGTDCGMITRSIGDCEAAHSHCIVPHG